MAPTPLTDGLREALAVFGRSAPGTPLTTNEVADQLDIGRRSTYSRLERLAEQDLLETKKVGARGRVWWRPPASVSAHANTDPKQPARAEAEPRPESLLLERILETSPIAIGVFDDRGDAIRVNQRFEDLLGVDGTDPGEYALGDRSPLDEDGEEIPYSERPASVALETGEPVEDERIQAVGGDGVSRWLSVNAEPLDGETDGVVVTMTDVTQLEEQAQILARQLDETGAELEQVFDRVDDAFWGLDDEFRFTYVNEKALEMLDRERSELVGANVWEAFPWLEGTHAREEFEEAMETGRSSHFEDHVEATGRWYDVRLYPAEGGLSAYYQEITERKERERRYEAIFNQTYQFTGLMEPDGTLIEANETAREFGGVDREEVVGRKVWDAYWFQHDDAADRVRAAVERARDGEFVREELAVRGADRVATIDFSVKPVTDEKGDVVLLVPEGRDITDLKERERELEESRNRYRAVVENFPNGAVTLVDRDLRYTTVGGTPLEEVDATVAELEGRRLQECLPQEFADLLVPRYAAALDGDRSEFEAEIGNQVYQFRTLPVRNDDGEVFAALGMSQDVTELKERERELERYETIVETVDDGIYALDEDGNFVLTNHAYCDMLDYDREELVGRHATMVHNDAIDLQAERLTKQVAEGERDLAVLEIDLHAKSGEPIPVESRFGQYPIGDGFGRCGVVRDITERKARERELERYVGIVDAVGEPVYELDEEGRFSFVNDAMVERSGYSESELLGEHVSIGMDDETVERVEAHLVDFLADGGGGRTTVEYEVITKGGRRIPTENRISVWVDGDGRYRGSAGILWDVTERHQRQRELERQRNRLEALNDLNGVVRGITDAVIEQSTREEIERIVCEYLAETESYMFAWIGDVDGPSGTVDLRAEAGVEGYLEDVTITVDVDDDRSRGPTGQALIEREVQISQDVENDPSHDPWREGVEEYGFRSSAAIPIVHEGSLFGVLNVYADRPNAFDDDEKAVIGQLGEIVGHAIAAVERKQALMSDEVLEIDFQIRDVFAELGVSPPADGSISFDQAVPIGDGTILLYGTATGAAVETFDALVESPNLPHWESANVLSSEGGRTRFELRTNEPPVISTIANHGGYVQEATIEDGVYYLQVHLAPSTDVRQVVDTVQQSYHTMVMVTRQQVSRREPTSAGPDGGPLCALTDRQRTALETAFFAGYFEWPRDSNGEDVAASIGIDPSTFHYHLREAQRKVIGSVLGGRT